MRNKKLFFGILWFIAQVSFAQEVAPGAELIKASVEDGEKLVAAYLRPLNKAIIFSLGESNYQAFPYKNKQGLSVGFKTVFLVAPPAQRVYDVTTLGLETLEPADPNRVHAQTILGDSLETITLQSTKKDPTGRPYYSFETPGGSGYPGFPLPYIELTYRKGRFNFSGGMIPLVSVPTTDLKIIMFKGSVNYNLTPLVNFLPEEKTEWSVGISSAYFHGYTLLNIEPGGIVLSPLATLTGDTTGPYDNQKFLLYYFSGSAYTYLAHRLAKHWRVFGGMGFVYGSAILKLVGRYPVYKTAPGGMVSVVAEDIVDPLFVREFYGQPYAEAGIRGDWKRFYVQLQGNVGIYSGGSLALGYKIF
ncbi:MAG: hypothetical protein GXO27_01150 [Chlorobi bacterium]|nr:hypothetical protein [Chlorobiota bacterium]